MSDTNLSQEPAATEPPATSQPALSPSEAGRMLASFRRNESKVQESQPKEAVDQSLGDINSSLRKHMASTNESPAQAEDAAPPQEAPGETQATEPEPEVPPIEPPRSWTKDEKERFATLPRETQEYLATREQERDAATRRSQNEAAEKLKGLTAKEQAVEQARQQYESALPILLQNLQATHAGEFADLKTMADVQKMAAEDWPRYIRWDAAQKQIAAVQQEAQVAQQRQHQERFSKFAEFASKEDALLTEKVPEMADEKKAADLQKKAVNALKAIGFNEQELGEAWNGQKPLELRDHRVQLLIRDAALWRDAQSKANEVTKKPIPPVQRPGTQRVAGADSVAEIQRLETQLDSGKLTVRQQLDVAAKLRSMKTPLIARRA